MPRTVEDDTSRQLHKKENQRKKIDKNVNFQQILGNVNSRN